MKHRLTYLAAAVVLVDLLALSAVWHVSPVLSLTVGLAVPEVEQLLSPLYPDPVREDVASGELLRPAHPRATLVLTADDREPALDLRAVARALARRDIAVLLPGSAAALDASVVYARTLGVPVRVENVAIFHEGGGPSTIALR